MKKIIIWALFAYFACGACQAQSLIESLYKNKISYSSSIVCDALSTELSIVRQQFRLARDGKTYGKNNKPYYGESYSLAIKISNGMILSSSVIEPWKNDVDYNRLNQSGQYKPELFWTYQRSLNDVDYHEVDLEFGTVYNHPLDAKQQLYVHDEKKGDFGLDIDETAGDKSGYMVWVSSTNLQDSAMSVSIKQTPLNLVASEDSARIALEASDDNNILGGLFLVPKYERGGRIQLRLVGVAVPAETDGKWDLHLLTKGNPVQKSDVAPTETGDNDASLEPTLIDSSTKETDKKKKKK